MDETGGNLGTLGAIGAGIAALVTGALAWITGRQRRQAEDYGYGAEAARYQAEADIIEKLREEVSRLTERVAKVEAESQRLRMRVWHLEDEMRKHNVPIPPPMKLSDDAE